MNELVTAIPTGITAFTATNLDDLVILTLLFSQVNTSFRCRHIVSGHYLGFAALVVVSLSGFFGGLFVPSHWIGLLGLVPIAMGMHRFFNPDDDDASEEFKAETEESNSSRLGSFFLPKLTTLQRSPSPMEETILGSMHRCLPAVILRIF
jgi:cadmium resistance protein CadD (predicted permease)